MESAFLGRVIGAQGNPGADGIDGAKGDRGKGYNIAGVWLMNHSYLNTDDTIDVVYYRGSSYYCKVTHSGTTPPPDDTEKWGLVASGMVRKIYLCTIGSVDWVEDNNILPYNYKAVKTFPTGSINGGSMFYLKMDERIRDAYGIEFGYAANDNLVFYAKTNYPADLDVRVYADEVIGEYINGIS